MEKENIDDMSGCDEFSSEPLVFRGSIIEPLKPGDSGIMYGGRCPRCGGRAVQMDVWWLEYCPVCRRNIVEHQGQRLALADDELDALIKSLERQ